MKKIVLVFLILIAVVTCGCGVTTQSYSAGDDNSDPNDNPPNLNPNPNLTPYGMIDVNKYTIEPGSGNVVVKKITIFGQDNLTIPIELEVNNGVFHFFYAKSGDSFLLNLSSNFSKGISAKWWVIELDLLGRSSFGEWKFLTPSPSENIVYENLVLYPKITATHGTLYPQGAYIDISSGEVSNVPNIDWDIQLFSYIAEFNPYTFSCVLLTAPGGEAGVYLANENENMDQHVVDERKVTACIAVFENGRAKTIVVKTKEGNYAYLKYSGYSSSYSGQNNEVTYNTDFFLVYFKKGNKSFYDCLTTVWPEDLNL